MATSRTKKTAVAPRPAAPENRERTYEVKDGDTLQKIADKHDTTVARLQQRNGIKRPELIWPGMTIDLS